MNAGTSVFVPTEINVLVDFNTQVNDSFPTTAPLYDKGVIDPNSLKKPKGCTGGGTATFWDSPAGKATITSTVKVSGSPVGEVTWKLKEADYEDSFVSWCVVFNTTTTDISALREQPWTLDINSLASADQKASPEASRAPSINPTVVPPFAVDVAAAAKAIAYGSTGMTFTN